MKDQYFGDRTDYIKHSLLRDFSSSSVPLSVHWNRTLDDGSTDGKHTSYLDDPKEWRHYDPRLFDKINSKVALGDRRLNHFQEFGFLPGARFCYDEWTSSPVQRSLSNGAFLNTLPDSSLVFYDPDNGLETKSIKPTAPGSHKYVYLQDLDMAWQSRHSILLYQHYPRVSRQEYLGSLMGQISNFLGCQERILAISTSFAAFICIPQIHHEKEMKHVLLAFATRWLPHTKLYAQQTRASENVASVVESLNNRQIELPLQSFLKIKY